MFFSTSFPKPVPIRKSVTTRLCRAAADNDSHMPENCGRIVRSAAAKMKKMIKMGILAFCPDFLNQEVVMTMGAIQAALVSLTVVPTASALLP